MCDDYEDKFHFVWKIKHFSFSTNKKGEALRSPPFVVDCLDETKWVLNVYPRGKEEEDYVEIYLMRCSQDDGGAQIPIVFSVELEAADSSRLERNTSEKRIFERNSSWGFHQYIRRSALLQDMKSTFLPDDTLTIHTTLERAESETEQIIEYIAESFAETVKVEVPWTIEHWDEDADINQIYKDVEFTEKQEALFRMFLFKSDGQQVSMHLQCQHAERRKNIHVKCRISVLDAGDSEVLVQTVHHQFKDASDVSTKKLFGSAEIKDALLQDGTLRLRCLLELQTGTEMHKMSQKVLTLPRDEDLEDCIERELVRDFDGLFLSGESSDVKVRAGSKVVNCHKFVFFSRSPVLSDLLHKAEETSEDEECVIHIDDLDGDTLEQMIRFMYSDTIKATLNPTSALKLLAAGHRYKVRYLKETCATYLSGALNFENVYDILIAAHTHEEGQLKRRAIRYISDYFARICLTAEWTAFSKTEKELLSHVCQEILKLKNF